MVCHNQNNGAQKLHMFEGPGGRDKADNHTSQREGGDKADLLNLDQATHSFWLLGYTLLVLTLAS